MGAVASRPVVAGAPTRARVVPARDPLAHVLGPKQSDEALVIAGGVAFAAHAALLAFAIVSGLLRDIHLAVAENRERLHDYFWRVYDVDLTPKDKPKAEEKAPDPPPEPDPAPPPPAPKAAAAPKDEDPYKNVAPAPAKAAPVLTQKENPDEPVDLSNSVVTGDGTATYGMVAANGKGDKPVLSPNASVKGVPGGTGTGTAAPAAPPAEDKSKPIALVGGATWSCPFPPEADADEINQAVVTVQVTVRPDGTALSANVVSDPGHGFGRAARICALARRYQPALDRAGSPVLSSAPVNVRFSR